MVAAAATPLDFHPDDTLAHRIVVAERPFIGYRGTLGLIEDVLNAAAGLA